MGWQVKGYMENKWAPNCTRLSARAISQGPTRLEIPSANPPSFSPANVSARIKNLTHGAV